MSDTEIKIGPLLLGVRSDLDGGANVLVRIRIADGMRTIGQVTMPRDTWQALGGAGEQRKEIARCSSCPFVHAETPESTPLCDAGHDFDTGEAWDDYPREIPRKHLHDEPPPDWCRLRSGPIVIRLEGSR